MKNLSLMMQSFLNDESGQDLIEYALVAALVGLGCVASLQSVATAVEGAMASIGSAVTAAI